MSDEMVEKARADLRNALRTTSVTDGWIEMVSPHMARFARSAVRDAVSECADFVMNWRNEDGNQQFGHYVIAAALRQKFNIEGER